jgi:hypothetical protein
VFGKFSGGHEFLLWKENEDDSWQQRVWQKATPKMTAAFARAVEDCKVLWARLQKDRKEYAWLTVSVSKTGEAAPKAYRRMYQVTRLSPLFTDRVGGKILFHYVGSPAADVS